MKSYTYNDRGVYMSKRILLSKRQFDLLKLLEEQNNWTSSKELGKWLGVSNKTIQNDLSELQDLIPEGWEIQTKKGRGIFLHAPFTESVISTFKHDASELLYEAIQLLIAQRTQTLREFSNRLFSSTTLTSMILEEVEQLASKYFLTVHRNPYYISGNEGMLRLFIFDTEYSKIGMLHYHQFIDDRRLRFQEVLAQTGEISHTPYGLNVFWSYLLVTVERMRQGFSAEPFPDVVETIINNSKLYEKLHPLFDWIEAEFLITLNKYERQYLYFALAHTEFYLLKSRDPYFYLQIKQPNHEFHEFYLFLTYLELNFHLPLSEDEEFLQNLFDIYYLALIRDFRIGFDYRSPDKFYRHFEDKPFLPSKRVHQLCDAWESFGNFSFQTESRAVLTTTLQTFIIQHTRVKVLFTTTRILPIGNFSLSILNREFAGKADFTWFEFSSLEELKEVAKDYDCLITDFVLPDNYIDIPYAFIDMIFSRKNINITYRLIEGVKRQKEQSYVEPQEIIYPTFHKQYEPVRSFTELPRITLNDIFPTKKDR